VTIGDEISGKIIYTFFHISMSSRSNMNNKLEMTM